MSKTNNETKKPKRKHNTVLIVLLVLILFIGIVCASVYAFLINKFNKLNYEDIRQDSKPAPTESVSSQPDALPSASPEAAAETDFRADEDVINILLVGVDNDYLPGMDQRGNSDGLIIVSLNKNTKKIIMTSILRDTSIMMPGGGSDKATLVYHNHGLETLIDSLEYTFGIKIDNYAMVNYLNVINIVDAAGGVTVELKSENIHEFQRKMKNVNYLVGDPEDSDMLDYGDVGMVTLNGKQTATFLRLRLTSENDFGRTARAREVLSQLKERVMDMSLSELNRFSDVVLENITTDLSGSDMMSLVLSVPKYIKYDIVTNRIPIDGSYTGDGSYIYPDYEKNKQALHEGIYGK